ncbi:MAG TPA: VWA-like domain-containing protein [Acidimicrobiales bacterium]|nr:VWA-like domain-containing protein [Acidimicrobiales bacterium]
MIEPVWELPEPGAESGSQSGAPFVQAHLVQAHREKVASARMWAATRWPYLATALFATTVVPSPGIKGLAVDPRWRLYADPEVLDAWSVEQIGSVLVHHVGHLLRDHAGRATALGISSETEADWVSAADMEINDDLVASGLQMPADPILPQAMGMEPGRFAEEYFQHLSVEGAECDVGECGSGAHGQRRSWDSRDDRGPHITPNEAEMLRCQVASEILRCDREGRGDVPLGLARWAESLIEPKVDWRRVLAAEVRRGVHKVAGAVDYSYQRRSRRQGASGDIILPGLVQPRPDVAVLCDTSGSMGDDELTTVLAEVEGLLSSIGCGRDRLRVLSCDAAVHAVQRVSSARQVELLGGGGTDMARGIEEAARLRPRPSVIVVLTDGMTPWPADAPRGITVVIALIGRGFATRAQVRSWPVPSWARMVEVDLDEAV